MSEYPSGGQGPATDRHNEPVVDPTANVIRDLEGAVRRLDDLRKAESRHVREVLRLRGAQRNHDLAHMSEVVKIRSSYDRQLRKAEASRIDAIRTVDVEAARQARGEAELRATALAAQVASSAEALRAQVASTATAAATSLAAALVPLTEAIADLRRAQYEQAGSKAQVVDSRAGSSVAIAAIGAIIAAVILALGVYAAFRTSASPQIIEVPVTQTTP